METNFSLSKTSTNKYLGYTRLGRGTTDNQASTGACLVYLPGVATRDNVIIDAGGVVTHYPLPSIIEVITTREEYFLRKRDEMQHSPIFKVRCAGTAKPVKTGKCK